MGQIPLSVSLDDGALFETYHSAGNELAVACLRQIAPPGVWLWGGEGSGKSHLLQAVAAVCNAPYLALGTIGSATALEGWQASSVIVLDDIDAVLGEPEWERRIFALFNAVTGGGGSFVASAAAAPTGIATGLPDLASRLGTLSVFQLRPLDDDGRAEALLLRAHQRGLGISRETAHYILRRYPRDMRSLYALLESLDRAALAARRRLTLPFVSDYLRDVTGAPPESA